MDRPVTTLFMLMSVDGKISTGSTDELDFDRDLPRLPGVREGLHQYYEIEQTTDLWSFNTGRVQAKMGVNEKEMPEKNAGIFCPSGQSSSIGAWRPLFCRQVQAGCYYHIKSLPPGFSCTRRKPAYHLSGGTFPEGCPAAP